MIYVFFLGCDETLISYHVVKHSWGNRDEIFCIDIWYVLVLRHVKESF